MLTLDAVEPGSLSHTDVALMVVLSNLLAAGHHAADRPK
jgi:hypothetical protein